MARAYLRLADQTKKPVAETWDQLAKVPQQQLDKLNTKMAFETQPDPQDPRPKLHDPKPKN